MRYSEFFAATEAITGPGLPSWSSAELARALAAHCGLDDALGEYLSGDLAVAVVCCAALLEDRGSAPDGLAALAALVWVEGVQGTSGHEVWPNWRRDAAWMLEEARADRGPGERLSLGSPGRWRPRPGGLLP